MPIDSTLPTYALKPGVCTSATRPASPYNGLLIYETDTRREMLYDGTGWVIMSEPQQTFIPAFNAGITVGNGSFIRGDYKRSDGWVDFLVTFQCGSTTAITGSLSVLLPFTPFNLVYGQIHAEFTDVSAGLQYQATTNDSYPTTIFAINTNSVYSSNNGMSAGVPFTFAVSDTINWSGRYRMASRYS